MMSMGGILPVEHSVILEHPSISAVESLVDGARNTVVGVNRSHRWACPDFEFPLAAHLPQSLDPPSG
jgi:hypothetical protein